jgi:hypothetical protein
MHLHIDLGRTAPAPVTLFAPVTSAAATPTASADTARDQDFYLELSKFHATMLSTRGSLMLVFQSMLLTAMAALHTKVPSIHTLWWFQLLGVATCCIWLYMNVLTALAEGHIWRKLMECDPRVKALSDMRRGLGSITWLMTYPLPILLGGIWAMLLFCGIR